MNLRPDSPSSDNIFSKGKFDFTIAAQALAGMKLGIRSQEQRSQALKRKISQQHHLHFAKIMQEKKIMKKKLVFNGLDPQSEADEFEEESHDGCQE